MGFDDDSETKFCDGRGHIPVWVLEVEAERDRYRAALERIREERTRDDPGDYRCVWCNARILPVGMRRVFEHREDCPTRIADEALKEGT